MQRAGRQMIGAFGVVAEGVAHRATIDPGLVDLVDRSEVEAGGIRGLGCAQGNLRAEPDRAGEVLELRYLPIAPIVHHGRRAVPRLRSIGRRIFAPRFGAGVITGLRAPPGFPLSGELPLRRGCILDVQGQGVEGRAVAECAQRRGTEPRTDVGAAPGGVHQSDRHLHGLLQLAREIKAGRRPVRHGGGCGALPCDRVREMLQRRRTDRVLHGQHPDPVIGGAADLAAGIPGPQHRQFHVRLARTQEYIAQQDIAGALVGAGTAPRAQDERSAGG